MGKSILKPHNAENFSSTFSPGNKGPFIFICIYESLL